MGRLVKMEEPASDEFIEMLRHVVLADQCRVVGRREPDSSAILFMTADYHSRLAAEIVNKLKGGRIQQDPPPLRRR